MANYRWSKCQLVACSKGETMKNLAKLLCLTFSLFGAAQAESAWSAVEQSPTAWDNVSELNSSVPVYDHGGETCNYSQWTETRSVNFSSGQKALASFVCAAAGYDVSRYYANNKTYTTIITRSPLLTVATGAGLVTYCQEFIEDVVTGFDSRTCTKSWSSYSKTCNTVCSSWD